MSKRKHGRARQEDTMEDSNRDDVVEPFEVTKGDYAPEGEPVSTEDAPAEAEPPPVTNEPTDHLPEAVPNLPSPEDAPPPTRDDTPEDPLDDREELLAALVQAALAIGYRVGWRAHDGRDVICIDSPVGPVAFHCRRRRETFGDLPGFGAYDGADTATRSRRLGRMFTR